MSNTNAILLNIPHTNPISVTLKSQKAENYHPEKGGVKICMEKGPAVGQNQQPIRLSSQVNSHMEVNQHKKLFIPLFLSDSGK